MKSHTGKITAALVVGSLVGIALPPHAEALHTKLPLVSQVTKATSVSTTGEPSFAVSSNFLAFHSSADLLNNGNANPQIFVHVPLLSLSRRPRQSVFQVTFDAQGNVNPAASRTARTIAFNTQNATIGGGRQIFFSRNGKFKTGKPIAWKQLTRGPGESYDAKLNAGGGFLLFTSTTDLNNDGLAPGTHFYVADLRAFEKARCPGYPCGVGNPGLRLVTREAAENAAIDATGKMVVFESRGDAAGTGCVNGASQIFRKNFTTGYTEQLTFGMADSHFPRPSQDNSRVYFTSAADLALSVPPNTRQNVFVQDVTLSPRPRARQLTFGTDGDVSELAATGTSGGRVFFRSTASHTGAAAGVDRVYLWQQQGLSTSILRLTDGQNILSPITADFAFLGLASDADLAGNGNIHPQIFMINSFRLQSIPLQPTPTFTPPPVRTVTPTPTQSPTPTATPFPGQPARIGMALLAAEAVDNGDTTLTTVVAATVGDYLGNPVADGTFVNFSIYSPTDGLVVSNGSTNTNPDCDVSLYVAKTGVQIINRVGVVHVCLTYASALAGTVHTVSAQAGVGTGYGQFKLPLPRNDCAVQGAPCSDANECTVGDTCVIGTGNECSGGTNAHHDCTSDVDCPDLNVCSGGANNGGQCTTVAECPDLRKCLDGDNNGAPCTTEFDCPAGSCALFSTGACLLQNDGTCQPTAPLVCQSGTVQTCADDGDPCTQDVCNFFTGECGVTLACPFDDNPCTDDLCNSATGGCGVPNTESCSIDENPCTDDVCDGTTGTCVPVPNSAPCNDGGNPCTDDICDGTTGTCGVPNTAPCDDGDFCTTDDTCGGGICVSGAAVTCPDDGHPCTQDICNPNTGTCGVPGPCACP